MMRKPHEIELPEIVGNNASPEWFDLRSRILRWVLDNEFAPPQIPEGGATDRYRDNWRTLLSVAEAGDWAERARSAYQTLSESYLEDDFSTVLLTALKEIFDRRDAEFLTSATLVSELNKDAGAWWYRKPPSRSWRLSCARSTSNHNSIEGVVAELLAADAATGERNWNN
jgi:hypothetical protein